MSKHTVTFDFNVGDEVLLKEPVKNGRVDLIQVDCLGIQYRVAYWDCGDKKSAWVYADEIELR
jgi:hypothetical protein